MFNRRRLCRSIGIAFIFLVSLLFAAFSVIRTQKWSKNNVKTPVKLAEMTHSARFLLDPVKTLESSLWSPLVLSECIPGMPSHWAPCIAAANPHLELGEELLFPDFSIALPQFPSEESRSILEREIRSRGVFVKDLRVFYLGQHGQNLVISNGSYQSDPPADKWSESSCMGAEVLHQGLIPQQPITSFDQESAILATTPDAWSFQHFLDRVTHVIEQASQLIDNNTVIVTSVRSGTAVPTMLNQLGFHESKVIRVSPIRAKRFIFSCRAPLTHPFFALRFVERMGVARQIPMAQRKIVLFLSRQGRSRAIRNEKRLIDGIKKLLKRRDKGEELMMFKDVNQQDYVSFIDWMGKNVRALIGAHGGAFYNHRFCSQDTLIIEMMPSKRIFTGIWEEAELLRQNYWMPIFESMSGDQIEADIYLILSTLDSQLGQKASVEPLRSHYRWKTSP